MLLLHLNHRDILLDAGEHYLGRSPTCAIAVADDLASRKHARLTVSSSGATLEDLASANGVWVNGARLVGARRLEANDVITIGSTEILVQREPQNVALRAQIETVDDRPPRSVPPPVLTDEPITGRWDLLATLSAATDDAIRKGRTADAATLVTAPLREMLEDARRGRATQPSAVERASLLAIKLGDALGNARWLDFAIELHRASRLSMAPSVLSALDRGVRRAPQIDVASLRGYVDDLQTRESAMSANERLGVRRVESVLALVAHRPLL